MMKRSIALLVAVVVFAFGLAYIFQPDRRIDFASFQTRFSTVIYDAGYRINESANCKPDQVALPVWMWVRWQPHMLYNHPKHFAIGFPNRADYYKIAASGSQPLDCFVRYFDGRAACMAIHAHPAQQSAAVALRSALAREFPGLPIALVTDYTK